MLWANIDTVPIFYDTAPLYRAINPCSSDNSQKVSWSINVWLLTYLLPTWHGVFNHLSHLPFNDLMILINWKQFNLWCQANISVRGVRGHKFESWPDYFGLQHNSKLMQLILNFDHLFSEICLYQHGKQV